MSTANLVTLNSPGSGPDKAIKPLNRDAGDKGSTGIQHVVVSTAAPVTVATSVVTIDTVNQFKAGPTQTFSTADGTGLRNGGRVQYQGTGTGYLAFGNASPGNVNGSLKMSPNQSFSLADLGAGIIQDNIYVASDTVGDVFVILIG